MKPQLTFVTLNYNTWMERWSTSLFTYIKCSFQTYSDMIGECLNNYNYTLYLYCVYIICYRALCLYLVAHDWKFPSSQLKKWKFRFLSDGR